MIKYSESEIIGKDEFVRILDELGLYEKLKNARSVAIKPNLAAGSYASPKKHICTDMEFLKNVITLCREINPGAEIRICESDSTGNGFAYLKFEHFGIPDTLFPDGAEGIEALDLSRDRLQHIKGDGKFRYFNSENKLFLSEKLLKADFFISLSNLKMHSVTLYTGACKNLFGCLPSAAKNQYHPYIHKVVHDLYFALKPDLSVVDAFYAMEKNGPVGGKSVIGTFRVFSEDAYEADAYSASSAGIKPKKVKYLSLIEKTKHSKIAPDKELTEKYRIKLKKPDTMLRINNAIGLFFQRIGSGIASFGDRLHVAKTPLRAMTSLFRPILIKLFGRNKLRQIVRGKKK